MNRKYLDNHISFLVNLAKESEDMTRKEMANIFNDKFGFNIDPRGVSQILIRHGIRAKTNGCFVKGQKAWNKGVKGYMGANKTSFKKGMTPHNTKPIGYERADKKDNYILVKTKNGFALKHRFIYESYYKTKLKPNEIVIFLDGNIRNFNISNLCVVTKSENAYMTVDKAHSLPVDIKKVAILNSKLKSKIKQIEVNNG